MERIVVYVDGFNLFYGLRSKGWRRFYWLDLQQLGKNLLRSGQRLQRVRYFTARVLEDPSDPGKVRRQDAYLDALSTLPDVSVHYGYFLRHRAYCRTCGDSWPTYEEKMTDVNIAMELLGDAEADRFDTALVVSGDSDLAGPIENVLARHSGKRVVVAFPPARVSNRLRRIATASLTIGPGVLGRSRLPERIEMEDGYRLTRPAEWS